ncbi:MAG TPA: hypothetical protein PLK12_13845 [Prolixibacteraceae bacterium]|nr:hypothetical protein [Prolixibacteraceae bacterium]
MESYQSCEMYGQLEKLEELSTVQYSVLHGTLVFESPAPFCGYYHDDPDTRGPVYLYLALEKRYTIFAIYRALNAVRASLSFPVDAVKAHISFNDRHFDALRLRHLNFDQVLDVQKAFQSEGIRLLHHSGHWNHVLARILLKKMFCMKRLSNEILLDAREENHSYLVLPRALGFDEFAEITQKVRNNWLGPRFDAAPGMFLREEKLVDFVRIYSSHQDLDNLERIRNLYLDKIERESGFYF